MGSTLRIEYMGIDKHQANDLELMVKDLSCEIVHREPRKGLDIDPQALQLIAQFIIPALGVIAGGFGKAIGAELWNLLKRGVKKIWRKDGKKCSIIISIQDEKAARKIEIDLKNVDRVSTINLLDSLEVFIPLLTQRMNEERLVRAWINQDSFNEGSWRVVQVRGQTGPREEIFFEDTGS